MAFTLITQGSFKSTGVPVNIPLQSGCDYFKTVNMTQLATTQATGRGFMFEWYSNPSFAPNKAIEWSKSNGTNVVNMSLVASGGFNFIQSYPQPQAAVTGTAITAATPAVVSMINTYNENDTVVLYGTTGMAQIGGMSFTISSVSGTNFTLLGLPAAGFAAPATAVKARRVFPFAPVVPEFLYVTAVSNAAQAQVTVSQNATLTGLIYVGQKLVFQVPSSFGMVELNTRNQPGTQDLPAIVTSIVDDYNFLINVDTSGFTPFAFPASTASPTAPLFATCAPAGSSTQYDPTLQTYTGYNFNDQPFRSSASFPLMNLQAGAQSPAGRSGDVIVWECYKAEATQYGGF